MATLVSAYATLADIASRLDPAGNIDQDIVELLSQDNEVLDDMLWREGNLPTGHKSTVRTSLPGGTFRQYNAGVPRQKSTTAQIIEPTAMLEDYGLVDRDLANLDGNAAAFRLTEDYATIEGLSQTFASTLFYGSQTTNPLSFTGFANRYNTVNPANNANAVNVIDAGGTASTNTSIWLICWGQGVFGVYPKGSKAGLSVDDVTTAAPVIDQNGNPFQAYQTHYKWDCGLVVKDWRRVVRIANIDVTTLTKNASTGPDLIALLGQAMYKPPSLPRPASSIQNMVNARGNTPLMPYKAALYMNRTIKAYVDLQAQYKANVLLQQAQFDGDAVMTYRGVPIRNVDALLNTEARVV